MSSMDLSQAAQEILVYFIITSILWHWILVCVLPVSSDYVNLFLYCFNMGDNNGLCICAYVESVN